MLFLDQKRRERQYEEVCQVESAGRGLRVIGDWKQISDRRSWQECLEDHCAELKGHRVVWRKDVDPYRMKSGRSVIRARQAGRKDEE